MDVLAQHPPASELFHRVALYTLLLTPRSVKVGGRRLSVTSKSKTQTHNTFAHLLIERLAFY
jgi:hypothetical protein